MQRWSGKSIENKRCLVFVIDTELYKILCAIVHMRLGRTMPTFGTITCCLLHKSSYYLDAPENEHSLRTFFRPSQTSGKVGSALKEGKNSEAKWGRRGWVLHLHVCFCEYFTGLYPNCV